jgi:SAM-dependent methyltransferase
VHFKDDFYDEAELAEYEPMSDVSVRGERMSRLIDHARRVFGERKDLSILDIGCGKGWHLDFLKSKGYTGVRGVEVNATGAKAARARGLKVDEGLLENQRYPDGSWDVVYMDQVIEHLEEPAPLLAEVFRILKPGGILWASVPNIRAWHILTRLKHRHRHFEGSRHLNYYTRATLRRTLEQAGFRVEANGTYFEEFTLNRLKGVLCNPADFDIAAIRRSKTPAAAGAPARKSPSKLRELVRAVAKPLNAPLIKLTQLTGGGAYIEAVGRK